MEKNRTNKFKDVTEQWVQESKPNTHTIKYDKTYVDINGIIHPIENLEVANLNYELEKDENNDAEWLENVFGGEIHRVPRITDINNNKMGCPTPDYIFRGERFELKTIKDNTKRTIDTKIKKDRVKANNFVIDIRKSKIKEKSHKFQTEQEQFLSYATNIL